MRSGLLSLSCVVTGLFDGISDHGAVMARGGACRPHEEDVY